jgi:hypothetical protein
MGIVQSTRSLPVLYTPASNLQRDKLDRETTTITTTSVNHSTNINQHNHVMAQHIRISAITT